MRTALAALLASGVPPIPPRGRLLAERGEVPALLKAQPRPVKKWDYAAPVPCSCNHVRLSKGAVKSKGATRQWVTKNEKPMAKAVTKFFASWRKKLSGQIAASLKKVDAAVAAQVDEVLASLDLSGFEEGFVDAVREFIADAFESGAENGGQTLGLGGVSRELIDRVSEQAKDYAERRSAELVGMRVVDGELRANPSAAYSITDSTREGLRGLVTEAITEGYSAAELADAMDENYALGADRASTVARTELAFAHVQGNMEVYKEYGVAGKSSLMADTHPETDECDDNADAGIIAFDDAFPSGDDAPPYHPNCLCDLLPHMQNEMEDEE